MSATPEGISRLVPLSRVNVRQKTTVLSGNKYAVVDPSGAPLLQAKEVGGINLLGGKSRPFEINVYDNEGQEVISLRRPYTFGPDKMRVSVCGRPASVVRQEMTLMKPVLSINDADDRPVFRVKGPALTAGECDFEIFTQSKKRVGVIRKKMGSWTRELLTDSDCFQIEFPQDLDVRFKAAIIGTCFLIDFLYYEN